MSEPRPLEELALGGPEHLDPAYVAGYDRKAAFDPGDDIVLLRERGLDSNSTLIDIGAGTGTFALAAAPFCKRVIAIDISPVMVEAIRARVESEGAANVVCVQAGFLSYDHIGPAAEFIYTRNTLHHLPDFWKTAALRRMNAMLATRGTLRLRDLVFSFDPSDAEAGIARWFEQAADDPERGWTRAELEEHVRSEYSTFTWLLEPMLERTGFQIVSAEYAPIGAYADYTCVKKD